MVFAHMRVLPVMPRKIHLMDVPEGITPAPEGALIRQARTALWPPISATAAAKKAGISPSRWQTVERGWRWASGDEDAAAQLGHASTAMTRRHYIAAKAKRAPDLTAILQRFAG